MINKKKGFTLIELLLVMAIIGILATVILVGIGDQRKRARTTSALESIKSAMPYLVDCYVQGDQPIRGAAASNVCNPSNGITWPALPTGCVYRANANIVPTNNFDIAYCDTDAAGSRVRCMVETSACEVY